MEEELLQHDADVSDGPAGLHGEADVRECGGCCTAGRTHVVPRPPVRRSCRTVDNLSSVASETVNALRTRG